ncbi:MAG: hypothetical protein ACLSWY_13925 [Ruthenibacterium lactatiformans]
MHNLVVSQAVVQKQSGVSGRTSRRRRSPGGADAVYALPFTRRYHPSYEALGGVPAIEEWNFPSSITAAAYT